jgi:hypothetical protein
MALFHFVRWTIIVIPNLPNISIVSGYVWSPVVEVNMFSSKSVNDMMENVILSLCRRGVRPGDITVDSVDHMFREELPLPDPCLGLVFGRTLSTFGFMPWQIRVTEFS